MDHLVLPDKSGAHQADPFVMGQGSPSSKRLSEPHQTPGPSFWVSRPDPTHLRASRGLAFHLFGPRPTLDGPGVELLAELEGIVSAWNSSTKRISKLEDQVVAAVEAW